MPIDQVYATYNWKENPGIARFKYCPVCGAQFKYERIGERTRPLCPSCGYILYRNPFPAVSVLIVDKNKVLLGKRSGEPGKGKWALPSGYIEFDEDFLTAAIREAKEETGFDIQVIAILNVQSAFLPPEYHFLGIYLLAEVIGGSVSSKDDLEEAAWFSASDPLPEMAFPPDAELVQNYFKGSLEGIKVKIQESRLRI